ncbi:MAG: hypothetical protein ACEQSK_13340 [Sphingomonadaceae bacterium]
MAAPAFLTRKRAIGAALAGALLAGLGAYTVYAAAGPELPPASSTAGSSASASTAASPGAAGSNGQHSSSSAAPRQRSREQAAAALMALPELQAWSAQLERASHGASHGALIEYDPTPRQLHGKSYWQFSFVENTPDAALRWESFLASTSDDEILVEDDVSGELLTLERWRQEKQPALRRRADN